jgi:hypothetical protein
MTTSLFGQPPCCPDVLGEVCWDDGIGGSGRAFALRLSDGTMQYVDMAGTGDISSDHIVACASDQPWTTINGTVARVVSSAAGNVAAGAASVTITNTGAAAGTVMGAPIATGETISLSAYSDPVTQRFVRLPQIDYNGTGTTLTITRQD